MTPADVIAIFDIGKTNKKLFLFDEDYRIVHEDSVRFQETHDEDGDPCENLPELTNWITASIERVLQMEEFNVRAFNFSTYGASFVLVDQQGHPIAPLYNYLKPYPETLSDSLYDAYGGRNEFSRMTASPILGSLNSGLQLYRLKKEKPELFQKLKYALHLPQYVSYLVTGRMYSDITSIGCHTALWNFTANRYHEWVFLEGINVKLANIFPSDQAIACNWKGRALLAGVGLHDSSAALIPYLSTNTDPFILLSTGTWCISLNPFNSSPLTVDELEMDCLMFMEYRGKPIKASRLFAGNEHEKQTKRLAAHFNLSPGFYKDIQFDGPLVKEFAAFVKDTDGMGQPRSMEESEFARRDLNQFPRVEFAYHQLMMDLVKAQVLSTRLVLKGSPVRNLYVDGGFAKNQIYMYLLAEAFPEMSIYAATVSQATALGAALAIHPSWNRHRIPKGLVELEQYAYDKDRIV